MITGLRRRRIGLLTAGLLGLVTVAGCSSEVEGRASESTSSSPAGSSSASGSTGAPVDVEDLSAGLLPADAFGAGAQVTPITADQLGQGGSQLGGLGLADLTITPESCAPAVKGTQPGLDDLAGLGAQTATAGSSATVEILAAGPGVTASVDDLASTAQTCPQATITAPTIGTATVTFGALDVPDLGDGSAGLTMTLALTGPDGQPVSVPLLLGMVADGDRLVSLTASDPTGAVDPAGFAALLQQAYEHQADVLDGAAGRRGAGAAHARTLHPVPGSGPAVVHSRGRRPQPELSSPGRRAAAGGSAACPTPTCLSPSASPIPGTSPRRCRT